MKTIRRETFIALRARRQAHQIAREILNPNLDLKQTYCRECGKFLRADRLDRHDQIPCHRCGHVNIIPDELAEKMRAAIPVAAPVDSGWGIIHYEPLRRSRMRLIAALLLVVIGLAYFVGLAFVAIHNGRAAR